MMCRMMKPSTRRGVLSALALAPLAFNGVVMAVHAPGYQSQLALGGLLLMVLAPVAVYLGRTDSRWVDKDGRRAALRVVRPRHGSRS